MASYWTIDTSYGKLTINSLNMHTAAWLVNDIRPLYVPQKYRVGNVVIPGAAGARAYKYRVDEAVHSLEMRITGKFTSTGGVNSNAFTGFRTNWETLRSSLLIPPTTAVGFSATITSVPGSTKTLTATVQVEGIDLGVEEGNRFNRAVLHLRIPAGRFTT